MSGSTVNTAGVQGRIIIPDPPNAIDQKYKGNLPQLLKDFTDWGQRSKGQINIQSAAIANPTVEKSSPSAGVTLSVTSDGLQSWGNGTYTTSGAGSITITHGLSMAPSFAVAVTLNAGNNGYMVNVESVSATTLTCTVIDTLAFGGGTVNSTAVTVMFNARV
jgi:hypothetical protein